MKEVWVLSERTDFNRGGEWDYQNYRSRSYAFSTFEKAKQAMRKRIVELAKEEKSMFHGGTTIDIVFDGDDEGPEALQYLLDGIATDENFSIPEDKRECLFDNYSISSVDANFEEEGWTDWMYGFGIVPSDEPVFIVGEPGICLDLAISFGTEIGEPSDIAKQIKNGKHFATELFLDDLNLYTGRKE